MLEKNILLIINPKAGKCKGIKKMPDIVRTIQSKGFLPTVLLTEKAGDARRYACEYGGRANIICCVGGDGTFSEVVSGIVEGGHSTPIGYLPSGSTNDYAASLHLSPDLCAAAEQVLDGVAQAFDIGLFNGHPFAYVAAFGMPAKVSYSVPQNIKNVLGHFAYILEGIRDLHALRAEAMAVHVDEEILEGKYLMGCFSNTMSIGGVLQFSPEDAIMDDGYLEVLLVSRPSTAREVTKMIYALRTRNYGDCPCITYRKAKKATIISENKLPWTIDGECMEDFRQSEIETLPKKIHVMVPDKNGPNAP